MSNDTTNDTINVKSKQKLILEINRNNLLSNEEKKIKIKEIMMGKYQNEKNIIKIDCNHYRKLCDQFYFTCCNKIYDCCRCHNQANLCKLKPTIKSIRCIKCDLHQNPNTNCSNCFVKFSRSHCDICNIWSEKNIFHCTKCGICRIGEQNKYFHCDSCQGCFKICKNDNEKNGQPDQISQTDQTNQTNQTNQNKHGKHICVSNLSPTIQCLLCLENASTSQFKLTCLEKCKHPVHSECLLLALKNGNYKCPMCRKSMINMSQNWKIIEQEILLHPLPEEAKKKVNILCNDCENKSDDLDWHFFGIKCNTCNGFNTTIL